MKIHCLAVSFLLFVGTVAMAELTAEESAAAKATEEWLALVDSGEYAKSWETAAPFLKMWFPRANGFAKFKVFANPWAP